MNLEVFNRVNWKESYHSSGRYKNKNTFGGMYSKWTSLTNKLYSRNCCENLEDQSVLSKFSSGIGKQVTIPIVRQLASNLGITQSAEPSKLTTEKDVFWCMEIISYGLTLPLTEHDTVRDCVHVYCEWLSALYPTPKISVPLPISRDPNFFARKIIAHLLNLFMPRNGEGSDVINKQAVLCHRVLRTLQQVTQDSKNIENDTWQTLLLFLLTINDALLAPPTIKDDVGDQLCERVLSVLLEIWLLACVKCYPSPPLWKTLREMAINWRHRTALIEQWNRINLILTSKILEIMYGLSFPQLKIGGDEDIQATVNNMCEETVAQTWFRVLHSIGNPVDLCHSNIISQTPQFLQYAITNDNASEHPCLSVLPLNFYKAIKGIAVLVDAFLGVPVSIQWEDYNSFYQSTTSLSNSSSNIQGAPFPINVSSGVGEINLPTPPSRRRLAKSLSVTSSKTQQKPFLGLSSSKVTSTATSSNVALNLTSQPISSSSASSLNYISHFNAGSRNSLSPLRPKCNSILHLFGEWLFEASYNLEFSRFAATNVSATPTAGPNRSGNWTTVADSGSISSGSISSFLLRKGSSSQPNSLTTDSSDPDTAATSQASSLMPSVFHSFCDKFICGRAEAVGTLCRIFCSKKTGEEILPIYLSRFYMIIQQSLRMKEFGECDEVMASVMLNSADIFGLDLDGSLLLVPYFIEALEIVLPDRNLRFKTNSGTSNEPSSLVMPSSTNAAVNTSSAVPSAVPSAPTTNALTSAIVTATATATVTAPISATFSASDSINHETSISSSHAEGISHDVHGNEHEYGSVSSAHVSTTGGNIGLSGNTTVTSINPTVNASIIGGTAGNMNVPATSIPMTTNTNNVSANSAFLPPSSLITTTSVPLVELRKACIHLLLSLLPLPLHFQNLPIREFGNTAYRIYSVSGSGITFGLLKPRLVNLLISALQVENDSCNAHLLLGGLLFIIHDSALYEQANISSTSHNDHTSESGANLLISDSAHSLFVRAMYLVCHRLISSWKADLNISLAALEFLTGLSKLKIKDVDILECKRAVKWLCDYIVYQCWRPPQAHSKDLHSSIVAAFQCAAHWLISHPLLLKDKECLGILLEVVELGISGTKSQAKPSEPIRMKDEKELKPVSMRVRDAAEALLTVILEQVGCIDISIYNYLEEKNERMWVFQADFGVHSISCLLNEAILMKQCTLASAVSSASDTVDISFDQAISKFHYFLFENNVMIALLQEPLGNDQDPQPTITLLIRNSFGRHAWTLQLRHLPRYKSTAKQYYNSLGSTTGRPISMAETTLVPDVHQRYFPDSINKIEAYKADKSIPTLENVEGDLNDDKLESLIEQQYNFEKDTSSAKELFEERNPPSTCYEFFTARMFLCHLGLLSKFRANNKEIESGSLIALDNRKEGFAQALKNLDTITRRTCDTCHVFYVKAGQKRHLDILENSMSRTNVSQNFVEMLYSLGWPVKVNQHNGWTGHVATSYNMLCENEVIRDMKRDKNETKPKDIETEDGTCLYDGIERILYWADSVSEIAFVVPSLRLQSFPFHGVGNWYERSVSIGNESSSDKTSHTHVNAPLDKRAVSLDASSSDSKAQNVSSGTFSKKKTNLVSNVMLVWLESFEDHANFPISELLPYTSTGMEGNYKVDVLRDCYIIFLHALQNGLLKVKLQGPESRINIATPLVDGMIISRRTAGQLVRQTVLNICKRRRLDCDSYQLPHVRRRLKLQEIKSKYECKMNPPELLTYLLSHC
ncbi:ral GTPase-activating protein subunit beta isoform X2 [Planococcus citri]|uniref:ral GTPase-activating protein subunit beta isoform X2 n=1 Tax=Planococcus citri TaxID=170843 RepID=UPI0031F902E7